MKRELRGSLGIARGRDSGELALGPVSTARLEGLAAQQARRRALLRRRHLRLLLIEVAALVVVGLVCSWMVLAAVVGFIGQGGAGP